MDSVTISHPTGILCGNISLPSSKSESNRLLILQALSGGLIEVHNLSQARDTKLLQEALASHEKTINIQDAGTAMRFLTAYYCATQQHKILTGTERMKERPIATLVDALRSIGFDIQYVDKEGFTPLAIIPNKRGIISKEVSIAGNISSQYISALLMIAPILPDGLMINFTTPLTSKPYIDLTLHLLKGCGINYIEGSSSISIPPQSFTHRSLSASADWSAASYWYSMASLAKGSDLILSKLSTGSAQGDAQIAEWMKQLGIETNYEESGARLLKTKADGVTHLDFRHQPDLAQTMIVLAAARGWGMTFSGLDSLRIKETDRIAALQAELLKLDVELYEKEQGIFALKGAINIASQSIATYHDHRMAMAFAPLALLGEITIEDPQVVTKSYPSFWQELYREGFKLQFHK